VNDQTNTAEPDDAQGERSGRKVRRSGPSFGHFYTLLVLVILVTGAAVFMFMTMSDSIVNLETRLSEVHETLKDSQTRQGKKLKSQLGDFEVALGETNKRLAALSASLEEDRAQLMEFRTTTNGKLAELAKSLDDQAKALVDLSAEMSDKIELARSEFAEKHEKMNGIVVQIQEDSKFIISELGKKAEKAYMRFMERKLRKKIGAVSDKVDDVKTDLEQQIVSTRATIEEMAGNLDEEIKTKVEKHVKIDFVPSASDEE